jgi:hypothetical protein
MSFGVLFGIPLGFRISTERVFGSFRDSFWDSGFPSEFSFGVPLWDSGFPWGSLQNVFSSHLGVPFGVRGSLEN